MTDPELNLLPLFCSAVPTGWKPLKLAFGLASANGALSANGRQRQQICSMAQGVGGERRR